MQAPLILQPPPLLALAQQVNQTRPRVSQAFLFHDLSTLLDPPQPMTVDNDHNYSSQPAGTNYTYAPRTQFDDASHSDPHNLYDVASSPQTGPQPYTSLPNTSSSNYTLVSHARTPEGTSPVNGTRYVSSSPSSVDDHPTTSFPQPYSAPHHQHHFPTSATSYSPPDMVRYPITNLSSRGTDKYTHALLEQRRMSEPAMYGSAIGGYSTSSSADLASGRYQQLQHHYTSSQSSPRLYGSYNSSLQRTLSSGSVRGQLSASSWNDKDHQLHCYDGVDIEEPISPLNPDFSGGEGSPTLGFLGMPYGNLSEDYGPSPPGTGTSTSSNGARRFVDASGSSADGKQYSFVALPGNAVKKRPRRRYDEIERLYQCSWPSCSKAYGTLNHLNAHVTMQKHGVKRSPNEFKELRKQWRKSKKEEADARAATSVAMARSTHHAYLQRGMHDSYPDVDYQLHSHPQQSSHVERFTPTASPPEMHEIDMQDVYERRQQRFSGLFPSASRTTSPTYTATHQPNMPSSHTAISRLPTNSTLLTPLPGYEHMGATTDLDVYASYGVYGDNRPGSGHGSTGSYDEKRRSG
ncbi:hypothetical protein BDR05DRAFT_962259 [Suillus weaverae]|nr:hypothetical protein BDR05DRAFT_962259 [Suillus weaverae]